MGARVGRRGPGLSVPAASSSEGADRPGVKTESIEGRLLVRHLLLEAWHLLLVAMHLFLVAMHLLLVAMHLFLVAMHLFLIASCYYFKAVRPV